MAKRRALIVLLMVFGLLGLSTINATAAGTPPPPVNTTPTPTPPGGGIINSITQVFHHLVFPAETISEALAGIFNRAASKEAGRMNKEIAKWTSVIGEIVQAPGIGDYARAAQSSLPVAAALAPALFLLRLALYHWGRLLGDDDSALRVIGDWVTAGALAVVAGPFLDMIVRLGWWMQGQVLGETSALAVQFVESTTAISFVQGISNLTFFGGVLSLGLSLGSLVAIAGLLFAFASANATLFILSISAAPLAVVSVVPQARWLRSLWIKALLIIAILPIAAGGVFKAGLSSSYLFDRQGLLSGVIRVMWLWGASGMLLSLAGILSKLTLTATADGLKAMVGAVQQIASIAALAAAGAGAVGAGAAGGMAAGGASAGAGAGPGPAGLGGAGAATGTATAGSSASGGISADSAALGHLNAAQSLTQQAATYDALGMHAPAQFSRAMAHSHEISARQAQLTERMQRVSGTETEGTNFGFAPTVNSGIASTFSGSQTDFQKSYDSLAPYMSQHGLTPDVFASQYPEDTGRMAQAYLDHPDDIRQAQDPLYRAAELGQVQHARDVIEFLPANWSAGSANP
ncbi:MAG: hypothetical protein WCK35_29675 [Chloroflexota bacterium]